MLVINLLELMGEDDWRELQESTRRITGATPFTVQLDESLVFPVACTDGACRSIRSTDEGLARCKGSKIELLQESCIHCKPCIKHCHAGFVQLALPIIVRDEVIGIMAGCMLRSDGPIDKERFIALAHELDIDPQTFISNVERMATADLESLDEKIERLHAILASKLITCAKDGRGYFPAVG